MYEYNGLASYCVLQEICSQQNYYCLKLHFPDYVNKGGSLHESLMQELGCRICLLTQYNTKYNKVSKPKSFLKTN